MSNCQHSLNRRYSLRCGGGGSQILFSFAFVWKYFSFNQHVGSSYSIFYNNKNNIKHDDTRALARTEELYRHTRWTQKGHLVSDYD